MMKISEFHNALTRAPKNELRFVLPDGGLIAPHAHITEVGRTDRRFMDCGGTVRATAACTLQAWVADDVEHRLLPGALASILMKAKPILGADDLDVEIEYEDGVLSQFPVLAASEKDGLLIFHLGLKHTDCLAKELCLPSTSDTEACCGSNCAC